MLDPRISSVGTQTDFASSRAIACSGRVVDLGATLPRVLFPAAISLWAVALWNSELRIGPYGLAHSLSPLFFVSMILLNASFLVAVRWGGRRTFWLAAHLVALVSFVDLTPIILEGTPRFVYIFTSYGYADYIVQEGYLNLAFTYHNWPGLHLLSAAFVQVTAMDPISLLLWAPLAIRAVTLLAFAFLFSKLSEDWRELWMALWLGVVFLAGAGHLVPPTFGYVLMIIVLALVTSRLLSKSKVGGRPVGSQVVLVILLAALVSAHLLTSLATVMDLVLLCGLALFMNRGKDTLLNTPVLAVVLVLCWLIYVAWSVTPLILPSAIREMLHFDVVADATLQMAASGAPQHTTVVLVRLGLVVILLSLAGIAVLQRVLSHRTLELRWAVPVAWVGGAASMVLLTAYNGEILERIFNLAFCALVVLAAKHLKGALFYLLVCAVFVAVLFYPISAWGNERVDFVPPSEIAAGEFFYEHTPSSFGIASRPARIWGYRSMETLNTVGYAWHFTVAGASIETHWSFLGQHHEWATLLQNETVPLGRIYDGASVQILVERGEAQQ